MNFKTVSAVLLVVVLFCQNSEGRPELSLSVQAVRPDGSGSKLQIPVLPLLTDVISRVTSVLSGLTNNLKQQAVNAVGTAASTVTAVKNTAGNLAGSVAGQAINTVNAVQNTAANLAGSVAGQAGAIAGQATNAVNAVQNTAANLAGSVAGQAGAIAGQAGSLAGQSDAGNINAQLSVGAV